MQSASEQTTPTQDPVALFKQLENYPWDTDEEFKSGLSAILGPDPSPEQAAELTLRARCFYYARKYGIHVHFDTYKAWKAEHEAAKGSHVNGQADDQQPASNEPEPGPKFSYQEIVEMIQSGKPIPGIKEIPDTVLEGQGTTATKSARRKPWEKDVPATESAASAETTAEAA